MRGAISPTQPAGVCKTSLFLWAGEHSAAVSPSSKKRCHFTVCSVPESLLGHIPPRLSAGGPGEMCVSGSCLLVSGGGHRGHSLHALALILVLAAPQGEPGRGRKGEMQWEPCRCANGTF